MKDISIYFSPVVTSETFAPESLGELMRIHTAGNFPDLQKGGIALFYVPEFRNGFPELHGRSDDGFRLPLTKLFPGANWTRTIYDLGTMLPGGSPTDTFFAIRQVVSELVKSDIIPIVIGGSQDLTYAMYEGYEELEQTVNVMSLDYKTDLGDPEEDLAADAYVNKLLMHRPCYLFNYTLLGYQTPFVRQSELDLFEKLYFDTVRLGEFAANFRIAEPLLRNTDILTIDLQAIRASEFQGDHYQNPNGFSNMEMCQLTRYAGIADKLTSFGIFNYLPGGVTPGSHGQVAQMIWYFMDGVAGRTGDFPVGSKKDYVRFTVHLDESGHDLVFLRSNRSDRWWMEIPYPPKDGVRFSRHHMVPCNRAEYDLALSGEIPDLWWKTYQKLG